jgi:putative aldouronate transport system substrate-binding protein
MKKLLVLLVMLSMVFTLITGCNESSTGKTDETTAGTTSTKTEATQTSTEPNWPEPNEMPIVEKPIQLTVFTQIGARTAANVGELNNLPALKDYEELTNIEVDYESIPQNEYENVANLMFASGDLADMVWVYGDFTEKYGVEDDLIIPLDELLQKYGDYWNQWIETLPVIEKTIEDSDGKVRMVPIISPEASAFPSRGFLIRQEWLDRLELDYPETIEEFYDVLVSFKENDPAGEGKTIPLSLKAKYELNSTFGIWGTSMYNFYPIDGKVQYGPITNAFKDALAWYAKIYEEGLLFKEYALYDSRVFDANMLDNTGCFYGGIDQFQAVLGPTGKYVAKAEEPGDLVLNDVFYPLKPIKGPDGTFYQTSTNIRNDSVAVKQGLAITKNCKYTKEAIKWLDYTLSQEATMLLKYGPKGKYWDINEEGYAMYLKDDDGKITPLKDIESYAIGFNRSLPMVINVHYGKTFPFTPEDLIGIPNKIHDYFGDNLIENYMAVNFSTADFSRQFPVYFKTTQEEQEEITNLTTDIGTYVEENLDRFIMGERKMSEFDDFVKQIKDMNIDRVIEIQQTAFDRIR